MQPVAATVNLFPAMGIPTVKMTRVQRTHAADFCQCLLEFSGMPSESTRSPPFKKINLLEISGGWNIATPRRDSASASWSGFGNARRRELAPATLSGALIRPSLVYPLASFDVSGQWPVNTQTPHLTRSILFWVSLHPPCRMRQDEIMRFLLQFS